MFPTTPLKYAGQLKSKKKHSKKKHSKKKHSKKKHSKKKLSKKRRKRKYIQKGGDTLDYYDEQLGWVTGSITYNDDGSITVNGNQIKCGGYEEKFKPNGDFHSWAFEQPGGGFQYIRPREPSNMTDLLTNWGC
jgi:hypothetical protein